MTVLRMTKTGRAFADRVEARRKAGEILRKTIGQYIFEFGDGWYLPR
jgi:hypothetical protein